MNAQTTKRQYQDVFKAMIGDKAAAQRLLDDGVVKTGYKLIDLYLAGNRLAEAVGPAVVESEARQAEKELDALSKSAASTLGSHKSPAKTAAARENAKRPRPNAQGKPKPRKPKTE